MTVPARPGRTSRGTAAAWVAVPLLLVAGAWPAWAADEGARAKPPLSLAVFVHHFGGESTFLNELTTSYREARSRPVQWSPYEWQDSAAKLKRWVGDSRDYAPDMVIVRDVDLPLVLGHLVSLEGRFPIAFLKEIYPGLLAQGRTEGVLMAVPWQAWPQALYYRADLFREKGLTPPKTPEELLDVARRLAHPPDLYGLGLPGRADGGAPEMFLTTFRAQGGVLFDEKSRLAIAGDPGRRTLQWWNDIVQAHATQPEILSWTDEELAQLFGAGRLAMLIERPWLLREAKLLPPPIEVGVAPVPREAGGWDSLRTDCIVIFDGTSDVDACADFIQYALGRERQRRLAGLGIPSVRRDCAGDLPDARWGAFREAFEHARGAPPGAWASVSDLLDRLLYNVVSGRATVPEALNAIDIDLVGEPDAQRVGLPAPSPHEGPRPRERAEGSR